MGIETPTVLDYRAFETSQFIKWRSLSCYRWTQKYLKITCAPENIIIFPYFLPSGNHYGTPKPPKDPQQASPFRRTNSMGTLLPGQHPSSEGKRRRNRSNIETTTSPKATPAQYPDEASVPPARNKALDRVHSLSNLGPLPKNWEMALTEDGTPYFIE